MQSGESDSNWGNGNDVPSRVRSRESDANLVDRMQFGLLPLKTASNMIPSVLSNWSPLVKVVNLVLRAICVPARDEPHHTKQPWKAPVLCGLWLVNTSAPGQRSLHSSEVARGVTQWMQKHSNVELHNANVAATPTQTKIKKIVGLIKFNCYHA